MVKQIPIKTAILILFLAGALSIGGTYVVLTSTGAPLVTGFTVAGTATVNVSETLAISLPRSVVSFGNQSTGDSNETRETATSNTPLPFTLQNDGNMWINVTIYAGNLFTSAEAANPSAYFRANSTENEAGVFNGTGPVPGVGNGTSGSYNITWINMHTVADPALIAAGMNFATAADLANVNINITVPSTEASGNKTATVTFTASAY